MLESKSHYGKRFWNYVKSRVTLLYCWWECTLVQPLWKAVWVQLKKLKMELSFHPVIQLLGIHPKELKKLIEKNISTCMFIAALFTMAKCPSVDEWIKQLWDIYIIVYFLVIKLKKVLPFATVWMDLENIVLSEIRLSEKDKYHMISLICGIYWTNWTNK